MGVYFEGTDWDNRPWDTAVGEVRATFMADRDGGLRFYTTDDRPDAPYIWVKLRSFGYNKEKPIMIQAKLAGWAYQSDNLKKEEWWHPELGKNGAWIIPEKFLRPMDTLPT